MYLDQKDFPMNNLSDSAKKKIEEASENFKLSDIPYPPLKNIFKAGYNAGYEVGRDEMKAEIDKWKDKYVEARSSGYAEGKEELQSQVQLLEDALKIISKVRNTDSKNGPWTIAKQALESLANMRGGK